MTSDLPAQLVLAHIGSGRDNARSLSQTAAPPQTEAPVKTVKDVLRNAARIIEERGWCQGEYERDGAVCLMGAIYAADGSGYEAALSLVANDAVLALLDELVAPVATWNDEYGRTAEQVIAALRAAADAA